MTRKTNSSFKKFREKLRLKKRKEGEGVGETWCEPSSPAEEDPSRITTTTLTINFKSEDGQNVTIIKEEPQDKVDVYLD